MLLYSFSSQSCKMLVQEYKKTMMEGNLNFSQLSCCRVKEDRGNTFKRHSLYTFSLFCYIMGKLMSWQIQKILVRLNECSGSAMWQKNILGLRINVYVKAIHTLQYVGTRNACCICSGFFLSMLYVCFPQCIPSEASHNPHNLCQILFLMQNISNPS